METMLEIPYGTRDFLPNEAMEKRVIEERIAKVLCRWGYSEVATPTMEYLDTLLMGTGKVRADGMFKLFDKNNRTLALRNEMTTPIARVVASRLKDETQPLKLSYISSVFRYEQTQSGRQCEFHQAGVELIGSSEAAADAEVIALAITVLKEVGLTNFKICLGQANFINGIMQQCCLSTKEQNKLKNAIERRDLVELAHIVDSAQLPEMAKTLLKKIPVLHGGEEVLQNAYDMTMNAQSREALDNLKEIYRLLKNYKVAEYVTFDLGIIRDFSYYTGMMFEAYTPGLGYPLCGGGRYDNMLSEFGTDKPATGFAVGIERIMLSLQRQDIPRPVQARYAYIAYAEGKEAEAISRALALRDMGHNVDLSTGVISEETAKDYQISRGYEQLIYVQ